MKGVREVREVVGEREVLNWVLAAVRCFLALGLRD